MKLSDLIRKDGIILDLEADDKKAVIKELVGAVKSVYSPPGFKKDEVVEALLKRETLGSTGMGNGVAVPHAKIEGAREIMGVLGRSPKGIDFNAIDGEPVHILFLILSPVDQADAHIRALQRISLAVRRPNFCKFLRGAKGVKDVLELFREVDESVKD